MYHLVMEFFLRILFSLLMVISVTACGSLIHRRTVPLSANAHLIEVPQLLQVNPTECGLVTASVLTGYYGRALGASEIQAMQTEAAETKAISGTTLQKTLESSGYEVHIFKGKIDNTATGLYYHIDRGRPLVAMIAKNGYKLSITHFVLVTGYDPETRQIIIHDPQFGKQVWAESEFQIVWERTKSFTLLATPSETPKSSHVINQGTQYVQN